jgi:drug/metabolite transporter (DMT)-like permease
VATSFKLALKNWNPEQVLLVASLVSTIILFTITAFQKKTKNLFSQDLNSVKTSFILGLINPFLYYLILFKAYSLLPAQEAQTLNYLWPILVAILSAVFLGHSFRPIDLLSLFTSFTGAAIIATHGNLTDLSFTNSYGVFLALISTLFFSIYWVINLRDQREDLVKLTTNFFFGTIAILVYVLSNSSLPTFEWTSFFASVHIGIFEMSLTFFFWLKALKLTESASTISNLLYLSPFLSFFFLVTILGEKILPSTIVGFLAIIIGIILQNIRKNLKRPSAST